MHGTSYCFQILPVLNRGVLNYTSDCNQTHFHVMEVVLPFFGTFSSWSDDPPSSSNSLSGLIYSPSSCNLPPYLFRRDLSEWAWSSATCSPSDSCIPASRQYYLIILHVLVGLGKWKQACYCYRGKL